MQILYVYGFLVGLALGLNLALLCYLFVKLLFIKIRKGNKDGKQDY